MPRAKEHSSDHLSRGKLRPFQRPWSRPFPLCWEAHCCPLVVGWQGVFQGWGWGVHLVPGIAALSSHVNECLFTVPGIKQACP